MTYATRDQTFRLGLGAAAFTPRPRRVVEIDVASSTFTLPGHGFVTGAESLNLLTFVVEDDGNAILGHASELGPTGLSLTTVYYPTPVGSSADLFTVSATPGGAKVTITTAGTGQLGVRLDYGPTLDMIREGEHARIANKLTAHGGAVLVDPVTGLYPFLLTRLEARATGREALRIIGLQDPAYAEAAKDLQLGAAQDEEDLKAFMAGRPILPVVTDATTFADNGAISDNDTTAGPLYGATRWRSAGGASL